MIYDAKDDPILPSLQSPKFRPDLNHVGSSSNFQDIFIIITDMIYDFKNYPILQASSQEPAMSSKSQIKPVG